ncbi:SDR family oxidoreductase [Microbacterium gorillae]|uniref:SDR family oxidoreductase n=1 Tax=Microbacterium gorillae TaxID=1231063 RepID=UPI003D9670A0
MTTRTAVVTGASSGIGRATAIALTNSGWDVVGVARRAERLQELADAHGIAVFAADLTDPTDVAALADWLQQRGAVHSVVQVAGGAAGTERVEDGRPEDWEWMFQANVLGTQRLVAALLPQLRATSAAGTHADLVFVTSTAAQTAYPGGGGYNAAKAGESMLVQALRLELNGEPIRVIEIAPGLVHTEEFTLNRLRGDDAAAQKVYQDVEAPLVAEDVADVIAYALNAPAHVNLDLVTMRPVAQAAAHVLARGPLRPRGYEA